MHVDKLTDKDKKYLELKNNIYKGLLSLAEDSKLTGDDNYINYLVLKEYCKQFFIDNEITKQHYNKLIKMIDSFIEG